MWLKQLILRNFRNYVNEAVNFSPGLNVIYGKNGVGKTNLLEALYLLSTGRSFRTNRLTDLIYKNSCHFYIQAYFEKHGIEQTISIGFDGKNKKIHYNAASLSNFSQLLGILPSVLYAPIDAQLITGAPIDRRRFLNIQLAQSDPSYVHHLMRYHKAMKNRNALLKAKNETSLDSWEKIMAESAIYLMKKRENLLNELRPKMQLFTQQLSNEEDLFTLCYSPSINTKQTKDIASVFYKHRNKELILGTTLIGPHRDDFLISYQQKDAKAYASEGQKRTCIAALKLAERERLYSNALLSIDDFGIHLDESRVHSLYQTISSIQQVFLSIPSDKLLKKFSYNRLLYIEEGKISSSNIMDTTKWLD